MAEPGYTVESKCETTEEEKSSSASSEVVIGIDIGTSQCSVAVWNGSEVELLKNTRNQPLIRFDVPVDNDIPLGEVNYHLSRKHERLSGASILNMKRLIGRVDTDRIVHASKNFPFLVQTLDMGVRPFIAALVNNVWKSTTPEELLALYLAELRIMAESKLKRPIKDVVLCIPVSFSRFQLTRIERACSIAGLHVLRLMPEPAAVALQYAQQQQHMLRDKTGRVGKRIALVFNMGAGFCDVAVADIDGGVTEIKALSGSEIGGEDLLENMMRHLLPSFDKLDIKSMGILRVAIQEAIHELSLEESVQIDVDLGNGSRLCKEVKREEFEEVNKYIFCESEILIVECMQNADVNVKDLTDVIVVGGCSCIPKIRNLVENLCEREIYKGMNPLTAAVYGTALEGALNSGIDDPLGDVDLLTSQVTTLGIGIRANRFEFVPVIPRNTTMPAHKEMIFTTFKDNQTEALIVVYEGEPELEDENHLLGYFKITGIPPALEGVPEINVGMDINASNELSVLARVIIPGSRQPVVPVMELKMPTVDDGHSCCNEVLDRAYGPTLDSMIVRRKNHSI
ncbi:hypothetical protein ES319_D09G235400v1 [Gossypium barbadense]|uniref:Heat shock 70 kDa protein 8 n=1 Tax=Gossypium barbadense TaxID=3634 RepID=A0A5J5Q7V8_GOSBA|nr:hypothetical protein ES319_D09G235400v1 [Gossypium barbadense]PPD66716.1 hypothetical protein GOBAR_DD36407 [Gossypium barbadense]